MPLTAEQKKLITAPEVLEAVEDLEKEVAVRNFESAERRTKLKKAEDDLKALGTNYNGILDKMKKLGFNPEEDIEAQFPSIIEKVTKDKGYKPSAEFDTLKKTIEKLSAEVTEWKGAAERKDKEAAVDKAASQFEPLLTEAFGKAASVVKDVLRLRGVLVLKDGAAGIQNGEEFIPLNAEKGKTSAIDFVKQTFPDLVVTKQKTGSGGKSSNKGAEGNKEMVSRAEFELMLPPKKLEYMQKVGQFTDNVQE